MRQVRTSTRELPSANHTYGALVAKDAEGAGAGTSIPASGPCLRVCGAKRSGLHTAPFSLSTDFTQSLAPPP